MMHVMRRGGICRGSLCHPYVCYVRCLSRGTAGAAETRTVSVPAYSRVSDLARALRVSTNTIMRDISVRHKKRFLCQFGSVWFQFNSMNEVIVPFECAQIIATKHKKEIALVDFDRLSPAAHEKHEKVPVIALLGHFNHGKTTLLDTLGGTNLVDEEAHGITQVVRTRCIDLKDGLGSSIRTTFVDTPGQEIFYRMRNYGAAVADVAILVVALNDGVCNQTKESIGVLESIDVPAVVCLNKVDHPDISRNMTRRVAEVESELKEYTALEDATFVQVSALKGTNMDVLQKEICATIRRVVADSTSDVTAGENGAPRYIGAGTVVNIWTNAIEGQMMHIVVTGGEVRPGQWFSSGGWIGTVSALFVDEKPFKGDCVTRGIGVKLRMSTKKNQEPRPIGDTVYFFAEREAALRVADYHFMRDSFAGHALSPQLTVQWELAKLKKNAKLPLRNATLPPLPVSSGDTGTLNGNREVDISSLSRPEQVYCDDIDMIGDENDSSDIGSDLSGDVIDEEEDGPTQLAVVKANSDLSMCTFLDALEEMKDSLVKNAVRGAESTKAYTAPNKVVSAGGKEFVLRRIIRGGLGDVALGDVLVAHTARAPILAYGVGIHPDAARQAENQRVKIAYFDKIQDVCDVLLGGDIDENSTRHPPKKSR